MLGLGPLRSETMLGEEVDAVWVDARAFDWAETPGCDCLVGFFFLFFFTVSFLLRSTDEGML